MKKLFAVLAIAFLATFSVATVGQAKGNAHHEEQDGCDHGHTGKTCRPDPSSHGKDCLKHGNHGGINEDHCVAPTPTPTVTPSPSVSPSPRKDPTPPAEGKGPRSSRTHRSRAVGTLATTGLTLWPFVLIAFYLVIAGGLIALWTSKTPIQKWSKR